MTVSLKKRKKDLDNHISKLLLTKHEYFVFTFDYSETEHRKTSCFTRQLTKNSLASFDCFKSIDKKILKPFCKLEYYTTFDFFEKSFKSIDSKNGQKNLVFFFKKFYFIEKDARNKCYFFYTHFLIIFKNKLLKENVITT